MKLDYDFKKDAAITGNLEVTVISAKNPAGALVHSKKGGDGFITADNVAAVIEKIKAAC